MNKTFSISEAVSFGWQTFRKSMLFWIVSASVVFLTQGSGGINLSNPGQNFNNNDYPTVDEIRMEQKYENNYQYYQDTNTLETSTPFKYEYMNQEQNISIQNKVLGAMTNQQPDFNPALLLLLIPLGLVALVAVIAITIFIALIRSAIQMGYMKQTLHAVRNKELKYETLLSEMNLHKAGRMLIASILYSIMVFLGLLFFIFPGIYLAVRFQYFTYFILDKNAQISESFKLSSELTKNVKIKLLGFGCVSVLIMFLGLLAFIVGIIPASIVIGLASAFIFETLRKQTFGELENAKPVVTE